MRYRHESIAVVCSDRITPIIADTDVGSFILPWGFTFNEVQASLVSGAATGTFTIDINDGAGGTSLLATKLTIDATETTSLTATAPPVLTSESAPVETPRGTVISIDVDDDASGDALGLIVYLIGFRHL